VILGGKPDGWGQVDDDQSVAAVRRALACRASLRRLGTDRIDLYQLHLGDLPAAEAEVAASTLEELVAEG
jgi:aryl-alcohol dehydrogenase-like predicted oxidoreductase